MNELTEAIRLEPTEAGYRVYVGDNTLIGHLLLRIWERGGRVMNGCLASPAWIDEASHRYPTMGQALDCLLSVYLRRREDS